jgi:hypothetical protein
MVGKVCEKYAVVASANTISTIGGMNILFNKSGKKLLLKKETSPEESTGDYK